MRVSLLPTLLPFNCLQVAFMLGEEPSVVEDCLQPVSQFEDIKTMLQYQRDLSQLDHSGKLVTKSEVVILWRRHVSSDWL